MALNIAGGDVKGSVRTPNEERSFLKFLKKDFEDLSLGPIKRPKRSRKKGTASEEEHSEEEESTLSQGGHESAHSERSVEQATQGHGGIRCEAMGDAAHDQAAEDAAARWRAEKLQKNCLHSDKPKDKEAGGAASPAIKEWSAFEAGWRVSTLPFRLARASIATTMTKTRLRPTWSARLEGAVGALRTMYNNTPLTMALLRMVPDRVLAAPAGLGTSTATVDLGSGLRAVWTLPEGTQHHAEAARTIFFVHSPDTNPTGAAHAGLVARLSQECQAAVLSVEYRRTPEHTREEGAADLARAYRWIASQPGVTPAQLLLGGEGLGAALAVQLCAGLGAPAAAGAEADAVPAALVLLSPWVDLHTFAAAPPAACVSGNADVDYLSPRVAQHVAEAYAGLLPLADPAVSPARAALGALPPTFLSVGQCEVLHAQAVAFAGQLSAAGTSVELDEAEDMPHGFMRLAGLHAACQAGLLRVAAFGRRMAPGQLRVSIGGVEAERAWEGAQQDA